jgi:hypothetical protein
MSLHKVSAAHMRAKFTGCIPEYIRDVCHARCCQSSSGPINVAVLPGEVARLERRRIPVVAGVIDSNERLCPCQTDEHLCSLHGTGDKPFGCTASPFTLNRNGTLIVRHRYYMLPCHRDGNVPAYRAFESSLRAVLAVDDEYERLAAHLDAGYGDTFVVLRPDVVAALEYINRAHVARSKEA